MKKLTLIMMLFFSAVNIFAQKETFDLVTYSAPKGWKKEIKEGNYVLFTNINQAVYCQIYVMHSIAGKGNLDADFESEWQALVVKSYNPAGKPQITEVTEENGWKAVVVHTGEAALRLLQMRNWDAVLLDDELSGLTSCMIMEHFREWEKKNRVNRQKNVFQVNSSYIPFVLGTSSSVQLPSGFDGALGKPLSTKIFQKFLEKSVEGNSCMSQDIVSR
jgi:CheY-like chemotaxis protein